MTITKITDSCRISGGTIISYTNSTNTDYSRRVIKKKQIEFAPAIILKKNENSPEKSNRSPEKDNNKYSKFPESNLHPYLTHYTQYKNAFNDEERRKTLSSFSKDVQLYIVVQIPSAIKYMPPFVLENIAFVLAAVKQNGLILEYLSDSFKCDSQIVCEAFNQNPHSLRHALFEWTILYQNGLALQYASDVVKNSRIMVLLAIRQNRTAFFYASEQLRKDQKIIDAASEPSIRSIQEIPVAMREDKETLLKLLRENGLEFQHIPEKYKTDLNIVLTALRQNYRVFEYLPDDLKNHGEVIRLVIWQDYSLLKYLNKKNATPYILSNGLLIQHVADSLKNDKSFAILALQQNKEAFHHLDSHLQNDPEIIDIYIQPDIDFPNASIEIRSNKIAALKAVRRNGLFIQFVDPKIQNDKEIILGAVQQNSWALQYLQRAYILQLLRERGDRLNYVGALRGDFELVQAAVRQNGLALKFALPPARNQECIALHAILQNFVAFNFLPDALKNNQQFVFKCLKIDPSIIELVSQEMLANRQFILAAVKENGMVLKYLQNDVWIQDDEIVHEAISQNRWVIEFAPDRIRTDEKCREKIERVNFLKYDKQVIFNLACKTTAVALTWKAGAVAGEVPTKIIPMFTKKDINGVNFSEKLSYKSRIYIIGHNFPGRHLFLSDTGMGVTVEEVTSIVRKFFEYKKFQKNEKVTVSLVSCYSGMSFDNKKSFAEELSVRLDQALVPARVIGRRAVVRRAIEPQMHQYKKIVDGVHKEPGMTVVFTTENGKTTMEYRYLDGLSIGEDIVEFPNFGTLFKNLSHYEIDLSVDGENEILEAVKNQFQAHCNSTTGRGGVGQWFFGKHPKIKNQKTVWFKNSLGNIDYARGAQHAYLKDDEGGVGDFDVYSLAHYLKKCQLKPENAILPSKTSTIG